MTKKNKILIIILTISFVLSALFFILNSDRYSRISFKFAHEIEDRLVIEDRYILLNGDKNKKIDLIIKELFLGPISVFNKKLVPYNFSYNSLVINNKTIYLDLPSEILNINDTMEFNTRIALIKENIKRNIKNITNVVITLDGQFIDSWPSKSLLPQGE